MVAEQRKKWYDAAVVKMESGEEGGNNEEVPLAVSS